MTQPSPDPGGARPPSHRPGRSSPAPEDVALTNGRTAEVGPSTSAHKSPCVSGWAECSEWWPKHRQPRDGTTPWASGGREHATVRWGRARERPRNQPGQCQRGPQGGTSHQDQEPRAQHTEGRPGLSGQSSPPGGGTRHPDSGSGTGEGAQGPGNKCRGRERTEETKQEQGGPPIKAQVRAEAPAGRVGPRALSLLLVGSWSGEFVLRDWGEKEEEVSTLPVLPGTSCYTQPPFWTFRL